MIDYEYELRTLRQYIDEQQERFDIMLKEFRDVCQHPNVKHTQRYNSGGFDYPASTDHYYTCADCGEQWHTNENHNSGFE